VGTLSQTYTKHTYCFARLKESAERSKPKGSTRRKRNLSIKVAAEVPNLTESLSYPKIRVMVVTDSLLKSGVEVVHIWTEFASGIFIHLIVFAQPLEF